MLRFSCAQDVLQSLQLGRARPAAPIPSLAVEMLPIPLLARTAMHLQKVTEVVGLGRCGQGSAMMLSLKGLLQH